MLIFTPFATMHHHHHYRPHHHRNECQRGAFSNGREPLFTVDQQKSSDCTKVTTGLQANIHTKNTERLLQEKYNNFFALCPEEQNKKYFCALYFKMPTTKLKLMLMFGDWWVGVKRLLSIFCKQSLHQVADT